MNLMNLINTNICENIYGTSYTNNIDKINESNYVWYYDKNKLDKIGINPNGSRLLHDSMLYKLKKFKIINSVIQNLNTTQLVLKLDNKLEENKEDNLNNYFTDMIFSEKSCYIIFKYVELNNKMTFSHIVFNGKIFK